MVKPVNIYALASAIKEDNDFNKIYFKQNDISLKKEEICQLITLLTKFDKSENRNIFDGWILGAKIQQISAEFDALRIGEDSIVYIDLKRELSSNKKEKATHKMVRDAQRLKILGKQVFAFLFDYKRDELLELSGDELIPVNSNSLQARLNFPVFTIENELESIDATKFLISPLDQQEKFISGQYILTDEQDEVVKEVINKTGIFGIIGQAGSGKTLVGFDIIKKLSQNLNLLFIPASGVHSEHTELGNKLHFKVTAPQSISNDDFDTDSIDIIVVDEAQRLRGSQRPTLFRWQKQNPEQRKLILLFDENQAISKKDDGRVTTAFLRGEKGNILKLNANIRSNPNIVYFVDGLFDKSKSNRKVEDNVTIEYFSSREHATEWIKSLKEINDVTITIPIPNNYGETTTYKEWHGLLNPLGAKTTNEVLGREMDETVSYIDDQFYYDESQLKARSISKYSYPYIPLGEEYVNLTRPKKHLYLAIVNAPEIYKVASRMLRGE